MRSDFEPFPDAPADWLVAHRDLLAGGGRALDVACGDGRNARYLAELATRWTRSMPPTWRSTRCARRRGSAAVGDRARVVDLEREPLPPGPYDVIVTMNFLQRDLFDAMQDALAPGRPADLRDARAGARRRARAQLQP